MDLQATMRVVGEVVVERVRQVEHHGRTLEHDDQHDRRSWAWYLGQRVHALACPFDEAVHDERRQLIEVAAIAVAAIEAHDRRHPGIIETNVIVDDELAERLRRWSAEAGRDEPVGTDRPAEVDP